MLLQKVLRAGCDDTCPLIKHLEGWLSLVYIVSSRSVKGYTVSACLKQQRVVVVGTTHNTMEQKKTKTKNPQKPKDQESIPDLIQEIDLCDSVGGLPRVLH